MSHKRRAALFATALVPILALCPVCLAGVDKEQNEIDAGDCQYGGMIWALDSDFKLFVSQGRGYLADDELKDDHLRSSGTQTPPDNPKNLEHMHAFMQDMTWEFTTTTTPTVHEVNRYWDVRFSRCTRKTAPTLVQSCHEYAWTISPKATGTYAYMAWADPEDWDPNNIDYIYTSDLKDYYLEPYLVAAGDILWYQSQSHSTVVMDVDPVYKLPSKLRWKWQQSGAYEYTPPVNSWRAWNTPMCRGDPPDLEEGKTPAEMGWEWDRDCATGPTPFTASDPEE